MSLKLFVMPEELKADFECLICGKGDCDVLAAQDFFGGLGGFHQECIDNLPDDEPQEDDDAPVVE